MSRGVSERCLQIISSQQLLSWATPPSPTRLPPLGAWPTKPKLVSVRNPTRVQCVECKRGFWTLPGGFFFFFNNAFYQQHLHICEREREFFFPLFFFPPALLFQHKADSVRAVKTAAANEPHAEASRTLYDSAGIKGQLLCLTASPEWKRHVIAA